MRDGGISRWPLLMPASRATSETDIPGSVVRLTQASFCSGVQRLRRCTPVMISIFEWLPEDIGISIVVFLSVSLRNTDGSVF